MCARIHKAARETRGEKTRSLCEARYIESERETDRERARETESERWGGREIVERAHV